MASCHQGRVLRYSCFFRTHCAVQRLSPTVQEHPPLEISATPPFLQSSSLFCDTLALRSLHRSPLRSKGAMEVCSWRWSFLGAASVGRATTWPWRCGLEKRMKINKNWRARKRKLSSREDDFRTMKYKVRAEEKQVKFVSEINVSENKMIKKRNMHILHFLSLSHN